MEIIIAVIIAVVFIFTIGPLISALNTKKRNADINQQNEYIYRNNVVVTTEYTYSTVLNSRQIRFIVDEPNQSLYIFMQRGHLEIIPFSDVLGAEICADNQVVDGVGCALVGGIIAGTTTNAICTYKVILYTKQISSPKRVLNIIDTKTQKDSFDYINAVSFAENVIATIKAIVSLQATQ